MLAIDDLDESILEKRFEALPVALRKTLISEDAARSIMRICADNGIEDKEDILAINQLSALVLLGFVGIDELAEEINAALSTNNPEFAQKIAGQINLGVFAKLKSEIEKNYRPTKHNQTTISDVNPPQIQPKRGAFAQQKQNPQSEPLSPKSPSDIVAPAQQQERPKPISQIPFVDHSSKEGLRASQNNVPSAPNNAAPIPWMPVRTLPESTVNPPIPAHIQPSSPTPTPTQAPSPVLIQQSENTAAPARNGDFRLGRKMSAQMDLGNAGAQKKTMPAIIEFGQAKNTDARPEAAKPPVPKSMSGPSDFVAPLSVTPTIDDKKRNITEITESSSEIKNAPIPKPPGISGVGIPTPGKTPETPPIPPKPKVIVKNFPQ